MRPNAAECGRAAVHGGHMQFLEDAERFNRELAAFVARARA
jgi:hypothetical protein